MQHGMFCLEPQQALPTLCLPKKFACSAGLYHCKGTPLQTAIGGSVNMASIHINYFAEPPNGKPCIKVILCLMVHKI